MSTQAEQEHQVAELLVFLSAATGREVIEAAISDDQHDPKTLRFNVRFSGVIDQELVPVDVDYEKLKNHLIAARATLDEEKKEPPPPPQYSRAMTLTTAPDARGNGQRVIDVFRDLNFLSESFADDADHAVKSLGLGLKVTHGPPANVSDGAWLTRLSIHSEMMTDTAAGCSFQFGAVDKTPEASLEALKVAITLTHP